jgi:hypothetical protein
VSPLTEWLAWFKGRPSLGDAPYEDLVRRYVALPEEVFGEFVRRVQPIVLLAAEEYGHRNGIANLRDFVVQKATEVFVSFAAVITSGRPELVLVRLAHVVRQTLDQEAFDSVSRMLYEQIPLYHLRDRDQRRCLQAMYASGLRATPREVAERLLLPETEAEALIKAGNQALQRVIEEDFTAEELHDMTEGHLP